MIKNKIILDATCGGRMMWFDKKHPSVVYADIRNEIIKQQDGREFHVTPDIQMDFTNMPFENKHFKVIVFDPPHSKWLNPNTVLGQHYGQLKPSWETDIKKGFEECWRVLDEMGVLIFKWHDKDIKLTKLLQVIGKEPLFGHTTGKQGRTIWMTFIKFPVETKEMPNEHGYEL
jgi:ubiquinone/menaquinone biosynthesis C-methylase UbiE